MAGRGQSPYPRELREQAVRLVKEWRKEHGRSDGGLAEVAEQLGVHVESIRNWLRQAARSRLISSTIGAPFVLDSLMARLLS